MQQAGQYLGRKQYSEAIGLLRACREEFPRLAVTYAMLAQAHLGAGDVAAAEAALKEGEKFEPMFSWEPPQIEKAKTAVRKAKLGSAAAVVGKELDSGGIPAAQKVLKKLLARRDKDGPVFDEADFNALGYKLMQENKLEAAVYMFEKGAELYPDSWNAYDSLGECLAKAGKRERAIESYRRSLELNPGTPTAAPPCSSWRRGNRIGWIAPEKRVTAMAHDIPANEPIGVLRPGSERKCPAPAP